MNKASEMSMILSKSGLVNDKDFCIKNCGSTFACVCEHCMKEMHEKMDELWDSLKTVNLKVKCECN